MIIKKIGTAQFSGGNDPEQGRGKREDETTSLEALRNSLGTGNTLGRGNLLENRYEIEQVIGYGGMSTVYRARDIRFTQTVRVCAVKEMFDVSTDPGVRQDKLKRFEEEANFLALLNHPAVPKIYDFFAANERRYLVEEYIQGKNLETMLEDLGGPVEEQQVLEWGIALCDVLAYLHNHKPKPIVFRDMKPSNVMTDNNGHLMLIDFGIAKTFQEEKKGTMIGTEGYSPPEQYKGLALPAGDIYALGATLHQLLTNSDPRVEVPFTFHERMPRRLNPKISEATEQVVMKALEFDIPKRWQTVEDLRAALLEVLGRPDFKANLTAYAPKPKPSGAGTRDLGGQYENGTGLNIHTSGIVAARQAGMTGINPTASRSNATTPVAPGRAGATNSVMNRRQASPTAETELTLTDDVPMGNLVWSFSCEEEVRSSPVVSNGMVYVGCYDSNLYALDARTGGFIWKAATQGGISSTPCIADRVVVIGSDDGGLYGYEAGKGQAVWNVRTNGPIRGSARYYAPMLFFGSDDQYIYCVEARTGKQVWKQRTWSQVRSTPTVQAGAVYIGSSDGQLYALDGNNGNVKWKFRALEGIISSPYIHDNMIFVGSLDGHMYCVDAGTSWALWKFKTGSYVNSSPIFHNGKVYFGSVDGFLYCLDAKNGRLVWKFNTGKQVTSSPRIAGGMVFFGGVDGLVYALDADKGTPRWYYPTEGPVTSSPMIEDGVVYIGSNDYHVYALSIR